MSKSAIETVLDEQRQAHSTRKNLFNQLEKEIGRPIISYYTSFNFPVQIEDGDGDMLEGVLQHLDLSEGLALMINSPGGDGMAAERIINLCRSYSGKDDFWAIVPSKAKSAATMICFGASKIFMSPSSELGPVDPQLTLFDQEKKAIRRFSVYNLVQSYEKLFEDATKAEGNLQPYLQQLANYDARDIEEYKAALALSEDIAIRALSSGMMKGKQKEEIKKKIASFLTPKKTKNHGRAIYRDETAKCGVKIEKVEPSDKLWKLVYNLHIRTDTFTSMVASKCIESKSHSFAAPPIHPNMGNPND